MSVQARDEFNSAMFSHVGNRVNSRIGKLEAAVLLWVVEC